MDDWLEEMDHYVRHHTEGRGMPSHVDARKVYRLLTRSAHDTDRTRHRVCRDLRIAMRSLADWMKDKKHWEDNKGKKKFPIVPDFGGPEAIIALIIIGGQGARLPQNWADRWAPLKLEHILHEVGSHPVDPFWRGAVFECQYWRGKVFRRTAYHEGENLSIYLDSFARRPNHLPRNDWLEPHMNDWTHTISYQNPDYQPDIPASTIDGRPVPGGSSVRRAPPSDMRGGVGPSRSSPSPLRAPPRTGNQAVPPRKNLSLRPNVFAAPAPKARGKKAATDDAPSTPGPSRPKRWRSQIIEERRRAATGGRGDGQVKQTYRYGKEQKQQKSPSRKTNISILYIAGFNRQCQWTSGRSGKRNLPDKQNNQETPAEKLTFPSFT